MIDCMAFVLKKNIFFQNCVPCFAVCMDAYIVLITYKSMSVYQLYPDASSCMCTPRYCALKQRSAVCGVASNRICMYVSL